MFKNKKLRDNLVKLYLVKALQMTLFFMPSIMIFYKAHGLSTTEVMLLFSLSSIFTVLFEIPSGYLADILGRKFSMASASFLYTLSFALYPMMFGFWPILFVEFIFAFARSLWSGADSALLFDTLKELGKENSYKNEESRIFFIGKLTESAGAVTGGFMAAVSLSIPFFASAFSMLLASFIILSLKEPQREKLEQDGNHFKKIMSTITFAIHHNKKIRWLIIFGGAIGASTLSSVWLLQPYAKEAGVSLSTFGIFWAILQLTGAFSAFFVHKFEEYLGFKRSFLYFVLAPNLASLLLSLKVSMWLLPFAFLFTTSRALSVPIIKDYINKETVSSVRATVLSVYSLFSRIIYIVFSPFIGYLADLYNIQTAFLGSTIIFGTLGFLSLPFLIKAHK